MEADQSATSLIVITANWTAMLAANVAHDLRRSPTDAAVAAWPVVTLVGSYELLMMIIRSAQAREPRRPRGVPERLQDTEPLKAPVALRPGACPCCARSAPSMQGNRMHGAGTTYLAALDDARAGGPWNIRLPYPGFGRVPD